MRNHLIIFFGLLGLSEIATLIYLGLGDVIITTNGILSLLLDGFGMYSIGTESTRYMTLFIALALLALALQWIMICLIFSRVFHYDPELLNKISSIVYPSMIGYSIAILIALYFTWKCIKNLKSNKL
jgi:hypothetical protein